MLATLESQPLFGLLSFGVIIVLVISFYRDRFIFRKAHRREGSLCQQPPRHPVWVPYFGSLIPFVFDSRDFLHRATSFAGQLTSSRVALLPWLDIYFFQDRQTVAQVWKQSSLLSTAYLRVFAFKKLFGMPSKWLRLYQPTSQDAETAAHANLPHDLHVGILKALVGSGSAPLFRRFQTILKKQLERTRRQEEWSQQSDFRHFVHQTVGRALIEAVFGPTFLEINPTFISDIFAFNEAIPWYSKGLPQFIRPGPYRVRRKLLEGFKRWYKHSREHFHESMIAEDGDGDPFWGCAWMRGRQELIGALNDDDMIASLDLGVAWGMMVNMVPSVLMALVHLFEDQSVLDRVREEIQATYGQRPAAEFDIQRLSSTPLLHSLYAETLRLHATSYTIVSAPDNEVALGRWRLPKGGMGLVSPEICHMDQNFWNTRGGLHPLRSFWADRFIVDPNDPSSGPILPGVVPKLQMQRKGFNGSGSKPYVSMEGLEGSWIPYSGGQLICPGRFLAQKVVIYSCILLASDFDIQLSTDTIWFEKTKYGLGTQEPEDELPYCIKARSKGDGFME